MVNVELRKCFLVACVFALNLTTAASVVWIAGLLKAALVHCPQQAAGLTQWLRFLRAGCTITVQQ